MTTNNTEPGVLLISKSRLVLNNCVAGLCDLGYGAGEAAQGLSRPMIGETYALEDADAHLAIEARTVIGKTLLEI